MQSIGAIIGEIATAPPKLTREEKAQQRQDLNQQENQTTTEPTERKNKYEVSSRDAE